MDKFELSLTALADVVGQPVEKLQEFFIDEAKTKEAPNGEKHFLEGEAVAGKVIEILKGEQTRFIGVGARKRMDEFETNVRKQFGVTDLTTQGEALIAKIVEKEREQSKTFEANQKAAAAKIAELQAQIEKANKLEGEDLARFVVNSEPHQKAVNELAEKLAAAEKKAATIAAEYEGREFNKTLRSKLTDAFNNFSPNIGGTPEQVEAQKSLFVNQLMGLADWRMDGDKIVPYEKGKTTQASDGNSRWLDLNGFVDYNASKFYPRHAADPSKAAPTTFVGKGGAPMPDLRGKSHEEVYSIVQQYREKPNYAEVVEYAAKYAESIDR
jgi:hypothetical protein